MSGSPDGPADNTTAAFVAAGEAPDDADREDLDLGQTMFPEDLWAAGVPKPVEHEQVVLLRLLGEGGMGEVWEAHQGSLNRKVAVKLVRQDASPLVHRRFGHEANLTAGLSHPNILPVHDLVEVAGRPALVMKLVQGESWDRHLNRQREADTVELAVEIQRLVAVCNAVVAAHEQGVLHLDIKLDNILVGRHGEVLLADWGCAAIYRESDWSRASALPLAQQIDTVFGTPGYLAPEQASCDGASLSPSTDVFLLGATLYALLESRTVRRSPSLDALLQEVLRPVELQFGAGTPASLRRLCCESLSQDPDGRPASAAAFRDALQGWLDHRASDALLAEAQLGVRSATTEPEQWEAWSRSVQLHEQVQVLSPDLPGAQQGLVEARQRLGSLAIQRGQPGLAHAHVAALPASPERDALLIQIEALRTDQRRSHRARRLLRGVLGTSAVVLVAALGLAVSFYVDSQASLQRATALAAFNGAILTGIEPETAEGLDTTLLQEILSEATVKAGASFADDPEQHAAVLSDVGGALLSIGEADEARRLFQEARALGEEPGVLSDGTVRRLDLEQWKADHSQDADSPRLLARIERLEADLRSTGAPHDPLWREAAELLIGALAASEKPEEALAKLDEVENILGAAREGGELDASLVRQRALLEAELGSAEQAVARLERLLQQREQELGPTAAAVLALRLDLAQVVWMVGDRGEAERLQQQAGQTIDQTFGPDHYLATRSVQQRWEQLTARGEPVDEDAVLRAFVLAKEAMGSPDTRRSLAAVVAVAVGLRRLHEYDQILELAELAEQAYPSGLLERTRSGLQLGNFHASALDRTGQTEAALARYVALLEAATATLGWNDRTTMTLRNNYGLRLHAQGHHEQAARIHLENLQAREEVLGRKHDHTILSRLQAGRCLLESGNSEQGMSLTREAFTDAEGVPGAVIHQLNAAAWMHNEGRHSDAVDLLGRIQPDTSYRTLVRDCLLMESLRKAGEHATLATAQGTCRESIAAHSSTPRGVAAALEFQVMALDATLALEGPEAQRREAQAALASARAVLGETEVPRRDQAAFNRLVELAEATE